MKIKIGKTIYDEVNGIGVSDGVLELVLSTEKVNVDTIESEIKGNTDKVLLINDDETEETFRGFTEYMSAYVDEETKSVIITLTTKDYKQPKAAESIEEQITDLQLAIAELYEMIGG